MMNETELKLTNFHEQHKTNKIKITTILSSGASFIGLALDGDIVALSLAISWSALGTASLSFTFLFTSSPNCMAFPNLLFGTLLLERNEMR